MQENIVLCNAIEQMNQLMELGITPKYVSMSLNAYEYFKDIEDDVTLIIGLPVIVNPYQDATVVVLSDAKTEFDYKDKW